MHTIIQIHLKIWDSADSRRVCPATTTSSNLMIPCLEFSVSWCRVVFIWLYRFCCSLFTFYVMHQFSLPTYFDFIFLYCSLAPFRKGKNKSFGVLRKTIYDLQTIFTLIAFFIYYHSRNLSHFSLCSMIISSFKSSWSCPQSARLTQR